MFNVHTQLNWIKCDSFVKTQSAHTHIRTHTHAYTSTKDMSAKKWEIEKKIWDDGNVKINVPLACPKNFHYTVKSFIHSIFFFSFEPSHHFVSPLVRKNNWVFGIYWWINGPSNGEQIKVVVNIFFIFSNLFIPND